MGDQVIPLPLSGEEYELWWSLALLVDSGLARDLVYFSEPRENMTDLERILAIMDPVDEEWRLYSRQSTSRQDLLRLGRQLIFNNPLISMPVVRLIMYQCRGEIDLAVGIIYYSVWENSSSDIVDISRIRWDLFLEHGLGSMFSTCGTVPLILYALAGREPTENWNQLKNNEEYEVLTHVYTEEELYPYVITYLDRIVCREGVEMAWEIAHDLGLLELLAPCHIVNPSPEIGLIGLVATIHHRAIRSSEGLIHHLRSKIGDDVCGVTRRVIQNVGSLITASIASLEN